MVNKKVNNQPQLASQHYQHQHYSTLNNNNRAEQQITTRDNQENLFIGHQQQQVTVKILTGVTSPIFNSMAVVSTSTPSSSSSSSNSSESVSSNNHSSSASSANNNESSDRDQFESNKIKLNIQNSRPVQKLQQQVTNNSGSSTLKLLIKKQDFAVQVSKDENESMSEAQTQQNLVTVYMTNKSNNNKPSDIIGDRLSKR